MVVLPLFSKIKKAVGYHGLFLYYNAETTKKPWRFKEILHGSYSIDLFYDVSDGQTSSCDCATTTSY